MKLKLTNVKLEKVAEGKQNAGSIFVTADLRQAGNRFASSWRHQPFFEENLVNEFRPYFDAAHFGTGEKAGESIPEDMLIIDNCLSETYVFPEIMVRIDENGMPIKNKFGIVPQYQSCNVLTMLYFDEIRNEWKYIKGWSLEERGQRIMGSLYAPMKHFQNTIFGGVQAPMAPAQSLINSVSAQQPATQPAPQQQQPIAPQQAPAPAQNAPINPNQPPF